MKEKKLTNWRGKYYNLEKSPFIYESNGKIYRFSNEYRRQLFVKRCYKIEDIIIRFEYQMFKALQCKDWLDIDKWEFYNKAVDQLYNISIK